MLYSSDHAHLKTNAALLMALFAVSSYLALRLWGSGARRGQRGGIDRTRACIVLALLRRLLLAQMMILASCAWRLYMRHARIEGTPASMK